MTSIERATTEAAIHAAEHLYDGPAQHDAVRRFQQEPGHHLLVAYDKSGRPVGMVSGVETTHPDKGTEMFLYELAVDPPARRHGIGAALVEALRDVARDLGCYGMWVLVDDDNDVALATYTRAGGVEEARPVMIGWDLRGEA